MRPNRKKVIDNKWSRIHRLAGSSSSSSRFVEGSCGVAVNHERVAFNFMDVFMPGAEEGVQLVRLLNIVGGNMMSNRKLVGTVFWVFMMWMVV